MRMRKATMYCYRLAAMPWSRQAKQRVVETLIYPLALYGCEAAPIYDSDMAKLTAAVAKAVGFYSHSSSNLMTAMLSGKGRNFCGQYTVLNRSLALLRRIIYKHPEVTQRIHDIYQLYLDKRMEGTIGEDEDTKPLQPCPPLGLGGRAAWNFSGKVKSPIGLLLVRIHGLAGYLGKDLTIRAYPDIHFDPIHCARQHLKSHVDDLCTCAMSRVVANNRSTYKDLGALDKSTYFRTMNRLSSDEQDALRRVQVLAHWTEAQQDACFDTTHNGLCHHCKQGQGRLLHLWECPALKDFRTSLDPDIALMNASNNPAHLLIGVPDMIRV